MRRLWQTLCAIIFVSILGRAVLLLRLHQLADVLLLSRTSCAEVVSTHYSSNYRTVHQRRLLSVLLLMPRAAPELHLLWHMEDQQQRALVALRQHLLRMAVD